MNVGDHYTSPVVGRARLRLRQLTCSRRRRRRRSSTAASGRESTSAATANQLAVATFNVENLGAGRPGVEVQPARGRSSSRTSRSPDLIAVEEIQDNSGATDDGVVAADVTLGKLVAAIQAAGGPAYDYREIDPVDDQDGGQPGGNIRVVLPVPHRPRPRLRRPRRAAARRPPTASPRRRRPALQPGPDRPANPAWTTSRKPLAGEFTWHGQQAVRDREPLQLQGRRRSAGRAAASRRQLAVRDAAAPAGDGRARLRRRACAPRTRPRTWSCSAT